MITKLTFPQRAALEEWSRRIRSDRNYSIGDVFPDPRGR